MIDNFNEVKKLYEQYDSEVLDEVCEKMFGHTDWEYVNNKLLKRYDDENYTVVLFHHIDTREEE